jgi:hypothetical protein
MRLGPASTRRPHSIKASEKPASRFIFTEGPHNTAVIKDRKTSELWTVDPWTHKGSEVPDIFLLEKWKVPRQEIPDFASLNPGYGLVDRPNGYLPSRGRDPI